jgi:hypothetical protein
MSHRITIQLGSVIAAMVVALTLMTVSAPAAQADTKGLADAIMNMHYETFIVYAGVSSPRPFDWSTDGCSPPTPSSLRRLFSQPCEQHDFGYRNYGSSDGGLRLGPNEKTRDWIDGRLRTEMGRLCDRSFWRWYQKANKAACHTEAFAMWTAVRHGGRPSFYG